MIHQEIIEIEKKEYRRSYAVGKCIIGEDGGEYSEALDPVDIERKYTEGKALEIPDPIVYQATRATLQHVFDLVANTKKEGVVKSEEYKEILDYYGVKYEEKEG